MFCRHGLESDRYANFARSGYLNPPKSRLVKYSQMHVYMAYLPTFGLNFWKYTSPIEHVG